MSIILLKECYVLCSLQLEASALGVAEPRHLLKLAYVLDGFIQLALLFNEPFLCLQEFQN